VATALCAAFALGLLFYQRSLIAVLAAIALLVVPHLIGAPQPASFETPIPEGLHHSFVIAVVVTTLLFWVLLGGLAGLFRGRFANAS
jgi:predicted cobalt transporter CbtA